MYIYIYIYIYTYIYNNNNNNANIIPIILRKINKSHVSTNLISLYTF